MILLIEMVAACILFTAAIVLGKKKNPLNGFHSLLLCRTDGVPAAV